MSKIVNLMFLLIVVVLPLRSEVRTIVIGGDYNFPPYEFLDSTGRADGYNVELMREIGKTLGWQIKFRLMPWKEVLNALAEKKIDLIEGLSYSKTRDSLFDFSTPHLINYHSIFKRKNSAAIHSIDDLNNREIVVQQDDIMHEFVLKNQFSDKIFVLPTRLDVLQSLANGEFDAAITGKYQSLYLIKKYRLDNLIPVGIPVAATNYCFAVTKGNQELKKSLDQALAMLKESGKYQEIYDRWFGVLEPLDPGSRQWKNNLHPLFLLIIGILVLLAVVATCYFTRRKFRGLTQKSIDGAFLKKLIDNYPGIIYLKDYKNDKRGRYLIANQAYADYLQIPAEQIIGKTCYDLYGAERAQGYWQNDQINLQNKSVTNLNEHLTNGHDVQFFLTTQFPVHDADGEIFGVGGISMDITRQHELQKMLHQEAEKFNLLTDNIDDGVIVTDVNGNIQQINRAAVLCLSCGKKNVTGDNLSQYLPEIELAGFRLGDSSAVCQILERTVGGVERAYKIRQIAIKTAEKLLIGQIILLKQVESFAVPKVLPVAQNTPRAVLKTVNDSSKTRARNMVVLPAISKLPDQKLILMLDDEDSILRIGQELLLILGYAVIVAHEGSEAVELYRQAIERNIKIDLLIFDLTIPSGMGGKDALAQIQQLDKTAKAIVCSGYSNDEVLANYAKYGFSAVLTKPYTMDNLSEVLGAIFNK